MSQHFFLLTLVFACCSLRASSRYLGQPSYGHQIYSPYADYGYSGYPYQIPSYYPPGTYFDQRRGCLKPFPGGGVPIIVDYHKRCSNHYVGLKPHPDEPQYYYVCKPDAVIFGRCQRFQQFNATSGQCVQTTPTDYEPTCTALGRFPIYSDCHLYYRCDKSMQPQIYSCPHNMIFSQETSKCVAGNKCTPTQIVADAESIPEYCENKYPPCLQNGIFRSPSDCSLYYTCELQEHGVYYQTRFKCPGETFYDLQSNACLPQEQVPCDVITLADLVYPRSHIRAYPRMDPFIRASEFDIDSLEENDHPIEISEENDDVKESNSSPDSSSNSSTDSSNSDISESTEVSTETTQVSTDPTEANTESATTEVEETTVASSSGDDTAADDGSDDDDDDDDDDEEDDDDDDDDAKVLGSDLDFGNTFILPSGKPKNPKDDSSESPIGTSHSGDNENVPGSDLDSGNTFVLPSGRPKNPKDGSVETEEDIDKADQMGPALALTEDPETSREKDDNNSKGRGDVSKERDNSGEGETSRKKDDNNSKGRGDDSNERDNSGEGETSRKKDDNDNKGRGDSSNGEGNSGEKETSREKDDNNSRDREDVSKGRDNSGEEEPSRKKDDIDNSGRGDNSNGEGNSGEEDNSNGGDNRGGDNGKIKGSDEDNIGGDDNDDDIEGGDDGNIEGGDDGNIGGGDDSNNESRGDGNIEDGNDDNIGGGDEGNVEVGDDGNIEGGDDGNTEKYDDDNIGGGDDGKIEDGDDGNIGGGGDGNTEDGNNGTIEVGADGNIEEGNDDNIGDGGDGNIGGGEIAGGNDGNIGAGNETAVTELNGKPCDDIVTDTGFEPNHHTHPRTQECHRTSKTMATPQATDENTATSQSITTNTPQSITISTLHSVNTNSTLGETEHLQSNRDPLKGVEGNTPLFDSAVNGFDQEFIPVSTQKYKFLSSIDDVGNDEQIVKELNKANAKDAHGFGATKDATDASSPVHQDDIDLDISNANNFNVESSFTEQPDSLDVGDHLTEQPIASTETTNLDSSHILDNGNDFDKDPSVLSNDIGIGSQFTTQPVASSTAAPEVLKSTKSIVNVSLDTIDDDNDSDDGPSVLSDYLDIGSHITEQPTSSESNKEAGPSSFRDTWDILGDDIDVIDEPSAISNNIDIGTQFTDQPKTTSTPAPASSKSTTNSNLNNSLDIVEDDIDPDEGPLVLSDYIDVGLHFTEPPTTTESNKETTSGLTDNIHIRTQFTDSPATSTNAPDDTDMDEYIPILNDSLDVVDHFTELPTTKTKESTLDSSHKLDNGNDSDNGPSILSDDIEKGSQFTNEPEASTTAPEVFKSTKSNDIFDDDHELYDDPLVLSDLGPHITEQPTSTESNIQKEKSSFTDSVVINDDDIDVNDEPSDLSDNIDIGTQFTDQPETLTPAPEVSESTPKSKVNDSLAILDGNIDLDDIDQDEDTSVISDYLDGGLHITEAPKSTEYNQKTTKSLLKDSEDIFGDDMDVDDGEPSISSDNIGVGTQFTEQPESLTAAPEVSKSIPKSKLNDSFDIINDNIGLDYFDIETHTTEPSTTTTTTDKRTTQSSLRNSVDILRDDIDVNDEPSVLFDNIDIETDQPITSTKEPTWSKASTKANLNGFLDVDHFSHTTMQPISIGANKETTNTSMKDSPDLLGDDSDGNDEFSIISDDIDKETQFTDKPVISTTTPSASKSTTKSNINDSVIITDDDFDLDDNSSVVNDNLDVELRITESPSTTESNKETTQFSLNNSVKILGDDIDVEDESSVLWDKIDIGSQFTDQPITSTTAPTLSTSTIHPNMNDSLDIIDDDIDPDEAPLVLSDYLDLGLHFTEPPPTTTESNNETTQTSWRDSADINLNDETWGVTDNIHIRTQFTDSPATSTNAPNVSKSITKSKANDSRDIIDDDIDPVDEPSVLSHDLDVGLHITEQPTTFESNKNATQSSLEDSMQTLGHDVDVNDEDLDLSHNLVVGTQFTDQPVISTTAPDISKATTKSNLNDSVIITDDDFDLDDNATVRNDYLDVGLRITEPPSTTESSKETTQSSLRDSVKILGNDINVNDESSVLWDKIDIGSQFTDQPLMSTTAPTLSTSTIHPNINDSLDIINDDDIDQDDEAFVLSDYLDLGLHFTEPPTTTESNEKAPPSSFKESVDTIGNDTDNIDIGSKFTTESIISTTAPISSKSSINLNLKDSLDIIDDDIDSDEGPLVLSDYIDVGIHGTEPPTTTESNKDITQTSWRNTMDILGDDNEVNDDPLVLTNNIDIGPQFTEQPITSTTTADPAFNTAKLSSLSSQENISDLNEDKTSVPADFIRNTSEHSNTLNSNLDETIITTTFLPPPITQSSTKFPETTPTPTPKYIQNTTDPSITTTTSTNTEEPPQELSVHFRQKSQCSKDTTAPSNRGTLNNATQQTNLVISIPSLDTKKPVNNSNSNNIVAPPPCEQDKSRMPRLEIFVEQPMDVRFVVCPKTCKKDHRHRYAGDGSRAVKLKWYPNKSRKTMSLETSNQIKVGDGAKDEISV